MAREQSERRGGWSAVATGAGVAGVAAAVALIGARQLGDFDLPWHLALGRQLVAARAVPRVDDLSYTFRGAAASCDLVADAGLYLLERGLGPTALQVFGGLCVAALVALWLCRSRPARGHVRVTFAALALVAAGPWLVVRPALASFVLLGAALAVVEAHRRGGSARGLAWLIPLQLLWANVHGFAVLGAALAVGYALFGAACRLRRQRLAALLPAEGGRGLPARAAVAVAAVAATCASTLGPRIFLGPFRVGAPGRFITEWAPTTPAFVLRHDPAFAVLAILALVALLPRRAAGRGAAGGPPEAGACDAFDAALVLGSLGLAMTAVRLIPVFAVVAAPICARRLAPALERARGRMALVALAGLLAAPAVVAEPGIPLGRGFDPANLPEGAVRFVASRRPAGPPWNFLPFGGWLEWRLHPAVRAFIDGRTAWLYPPGFVAEYEEAEHDPGVFARLERRYGFQWAVVRARPGEVFGEPLARDARWALVYLDETAAVYVRRDGPNAALAAEGYRVLRHLTPPALLLAERAPPPLLLHDAALAVAQAPDSPRAHFVAAAAALAAGDPGGARRERERIAALDPDYPGLALLDSAATAAAGR